MQTPNPTPWFVSTLQALQWPVIVVAAFFVGRAVAKIESRINKAEKSLSDLIERHMPHIHNALSELRGITQGRR